MENNSSKISIIIPIYNVGDYLTKAIDSIINQSFKDFDLFLVDDGSTDNSGAICDEYAKKDSRIKVFHIENGGAPNARNVALKVANSEYVCFFDGDDYIEKDTLSDMYFLAKKFDANLLITGFFIDTYYNDKDYLTLDYIPVFTNKTEIKIANNNDKNSDNANIAQVEFFDDKNNFRINAYKNFDRNMFYSPWNKMYKLAYLRENNLTFPNTYRDDFPFVVSVIKDIDKVLFTSKQYYHFIRKRTDSETQKYVAKLYDKREEEHKMMLSLYEHWNLSNDDNSNEMISRRYIDRVIESMVNLFNKKCTLNNSEKLMEIKKYLNNQYISNALKFAKPKKLYLKVMYVPIKLKSSILCFIMCSFINFIKSKSIKIFTILKTKR